MQQTRSKEEIAAEQALHRRLGPVQEAYYDQKNYRGVVKTCEAALKKDPRQPHLRCFLAMARQQLGEGREARRQLEQCAAQVRDKDGELVLRLLRPALETSGQLDVLATVLGSFVALHEKQPTPDSLKCEMLLFHVLFRLGDYQRAAKQAMRVKQLAATHPDVKDGPDKAHKSVIWSIMCNFWNFKTNGATMSLMLAERMLEKMAAEDKLVSGEDVGLYCNVLQAAGKLNEAQAIVNGPLGAKAFPFEEERLKFLLQMVTAAKMQDQILACCLKILDESADDWDAWVGALDASNNDADGKLMVLAESLIKKYPAKRGPRLAVLEVAARKKDAGRLQSLLLSYFETFGHKACFWGDVARYATILKSAGGADATDKLIKDMTASLANVDWTTECRLREYSARELESESDPHREARDGRDAGKVDTWSPEDEQRQKQMARRAAIAKLEVTLGITKTPEECQELFRQYEAASHLYRSHLQITEEGPNDDLIIVVAHHLRAQGKHLDAAALCVASLERTPHAFQPKLLLIELASGMGAFSYAGDMYRLLECKYVQNDSMGHFALPAAVRLGDSSWLEEVWRSMTDWRALSVQRSIPQDTSKCFSNGKWTQVEGFVHFRQRVDRSTHFLACELEHLMSQLFLGKSVSPDAAKATIHLARERGATFAGTRNGIEWLESVVEDCTSYTGKEDTRLSCNYDMRVKADFTAVQTKQEYLAAEWTVPTEMLHLLAVRASIVRLVEASVKHEASALVEAGKCILDTPKSSLEPHYGKCLDAFLAIVRATHVLASCGVEDFTPASTALGQVCEAAKALSTLFLDTTADFPALNLGWANDVSCFVFEVAPLALIVAQSWKKFGQPAKSVRNKMSPETKKTFSAMLQGIKDATEAISTLTHATVEMAKKHAGRESLEADLTAFAKKDSSMGGMADEALTTVCHRVAVSWKAFMTNVGARGHALKFD